MSVVPPPDLSRQPLLLPVTHYLSRTASQCEVATCQKQWHRRRAGTEMMRPSPAESARGAARLRFGSLRGLFSWIRCLRTDCALCCLERMTFAFGE